MASISDELTELARSISVYDVVRSLGIEMRYGPEMVQQFRCPLHGDGRDEKGAGSARYYPDSNRTKCWGCDKTRDSIDWYKEYYGLQFADAVEKLCEDFLSIDINRYRSGNVQQAKIEGILILEELEDRFRIYSPQLSLEKRVIFSNTLDKLWITGCTHQHRKSVEDFLERNLNANRTNNV